MEIPGGKDLDKEDCILIVKYLDNVLSPVERLHFEQRLVRDTLLRQSIQAMSDIWREAQRSRGWIEVDTARAFERVSRKLINPGA